MRKELFEQQVRLQYLWQCPLGERPKKRKRNVRLNPGPTLFEFGNPEDHFSHLPYKIAHRLEQRDPDSISGIWGISHWRAERMFGNVTVELCPNELPYKDVTDDIWEKARSFRKLCYYRITSAEEAIRLLSKDREVRFAFEITCDWYDPEDGILPTLAESPEFLNSHAVPIIAFDSQTRRFVFPNSWGTEWGHNGWGQFPIENWDRSIVSAWDTVCAGLFIPNEIESGIAVRGWKWGTDYSSGIHCIDIYDVDSDEYLAWAFCIVRNGRLDVEEFFVRPEERGKGYARQLAAYVRRLAEELKKPVRLVVGFADTEEYSIDGAEAVAKLFEVELYESDVRWASKFGLAQPIATPARSWKPNRPESILEKLRPRSEDPIRDPRQYTVFFGTNRKPVDAENIGKGFLNERGYELHRGSCLVEIPVTHKFGSVGRAWLKFLDRSSGSELRVVGTQGLTPEEVKIFVMNLMRKIETTYDRHNLLYIHGYQNSFNDAAKRAAQIGVDLKINGSTFFFSWPSSATTAGYPADEATIETSIKYCQEFVIEILKAFPDIPLHVLAHSMGNRLALNLFECLAALDSVPGKLGQLIFAAADVDVDRFNDSIEKIKHLPQRLTSYVSRGDLALHLSERIHDFPRVGLAPPILRHNHVDTILAEDFAISEVLGHGYYAEAEALLTDLFSLIRHGSPPDERPRTRREADATSPIPFWSLPVG
jgi:esterase/lipase superfamily enzyme/GNAT superfamily N-acetyltransferase